ncbi:MAG: sigma-54-dependent Fis family transcriptional regulator [Gemmobacter sp.]
MSVQKRLFPPSERSGLVRARARLENRRVVEGTFLSDPVALSWQRCVDAQMDPLDQPDNLVVDAGKMGRLLRQHSVLRALARPELEQLFRQVTGSNYMLALGTPDGIITDILADTSFLETKASKTVVEGSIWTEALRGTNGMGLAIMDRAPRSVWRGEHFFREQGHVSCISVPIFDSGGDIAGVLDASTASEDWHAHTMALLALSASNIEAGLFHYEQQAHTILRVHPRPEYLPTLSAGLVAIDPDGVVVAVSMRGRDFLRIDSDKTPEFLDDILADAVGVVIGNLMRSGRAACALRQGGTVWISSDHLRLQQVYGFHAALADQKPSVAAGRDVSRPIKASPSLSDGGFVATDLRIRAQMETLERVVRRRVPVQIIGESGTGRESVARFAHARSGRAGPFVAVNCAALSRDTCAAELFGQVDRMTRVDPPGLLGSAQNGTLFLEDADLLPTAAHADLNRFLDTGEVRPIGGAATVTLDVQVISAITSPGSLSKKHTRDVVASRRGRGLFLLNAFAIMLPALRERTDIRDIARSLLAQMAVGVEITSDAMRALCTHEWPGNIREMRTSLNVAIAICDDNQIRPQDILRALPGHPAASDLDHVSGQCRPSACCACRDSSLRRNRCIQMRETYLAQRKNASRTARVLGISRSTLHEHIRGLRGD